MAPIASEPRPSPVAHRTCRHNGVLLISSRRAAVTLLAALGLVASGVASLPAAGAATGQAAPPAPTDVSAPTTTIDIRAQQAETRRKVDELRRQTDAVRVDAARANAQLAKAQAELAAQQKLLVEASEAARQANDAADAATAAAADAQQRADAAGQKVKDLAIQAYLHPASEQSVELLASTSFTEMRHKQTLLDVTTRQHSDLLEERRVSLAALRERQAAATDAVAAAKTALDAQQATLVQAESARDLEADIADQLNGQVNSGINAVAQLASVDQQLGSQIAREDAAEAAARTTVPAATAPPAPGAAPRPIPAPTTRAPATTRPPTTTIPPGNYIPPPLVSSGDLTKVSGIWVHSSIADNVAALIAAGSAAGLRFGGGGYRDPASQVELRRAHCGPTDYDIYYRPSGECSPPTARPGTSMHEQGLAIDFTCSNVLIASHSDPCWIWLNANAAAYGLFNLPSEPWHWSVNGR